MFVDMYDKKILGKLHKFQKEYKTTIVLHVVKNEAKFVDVSKFVCLVECIVPLENFSLIWRRHHCG